MIGLILRSATSQYHKGKGDTDNRNMSAMISGDASVTGNHIGKPWKSFIKYIPGDRPKLYWRDTVDTPWRSAGLLSEVGVKFRDRLWPAEMESLKIFTPLLNQEFEIVTGFNALGNHIQVKLASHGH